MRLPDTKDFSTSSKSGRRAEWVGTASVFAMASFLFPQAALATCAPTGPGTTECTGSNPNTVVTQGGAGSQTVNITTGADVSSTTSTVSVSGADATITNDGTVSTDGTGGSSSYSALIASGAGGTATIDNRGAATSDGVNAIGARLLSNGGVVELINSGSISATGGRTSGSLGPVGASLSAISSDVSVTNSGSMSGDGIGLFVQHGGTGETSITNAASGLISGVNNGIFIRDALGPVQILNAGSIVRTDTGAAGFVPGGITIFDQNVNATGTQVSIVNTGLIDGGGSWGILANQRSLGALEIDNRGTINGGILSTGGLPTVINNQGIIVGDVIFGDGNDFLNLIGNAARLNGDFNAGAGVDTMQFSNVTGWVYSGSIDNVEALSLLGSADITFDNASISLNGAVGSFNILSAATLRVAGNSTIRFNDGGAITNDGTIVLAPGAIFDATSFGTPASFVSSNDSTVQFVLDTVSGSSAISGQLRANTITFQSGSQIDVDVRDLSLLINGRTIDVAVAGTSLTDASGAVTDNSVLFDFSKDVVGGTTLRLTVQQLLSIADTINPANPNSAALAAALQDLIDSGTASGDAVSTVLGQYSDAASLAVGVGDFAPDDSNSVTLSQLAGIDRVHGLIRSRLADRSLTDKKQNLWMQAGREKQSLDAAAFTEGFDGKGWSVAGGVDTELAGGSFIVGAGFDHQKSDLDRTGTRVAKGDLTSDRLFLYTSNTSGPVVFNADAGIGRGKAELARSISALGEIAQGRSTTKQIFGRAELGYRFGDQGWSITPVAGLQASRLKIDGYTEAGSAGALSYADRTVTSTKGDAGAIVSWQASDNGSVRMRLDADLRVTREFKDLDDPLMARFAGSGSNFAYQVNAPGSTSKQAELGAHFDFGSSATLSFVYRGTFADGARENAGAISFAIGF